MGALLGGYEFDERCEDLKMTDEFTYLNKPTWVANSFLLRAREQKVGDVDPLKLQKLVYCFHGWHMAVTGSPALGERFEAWPHGPVLSSLYHQFKNFRWNPITSLALDVDPKTGDEEALYVSTADRGFYKIFDSVWERYKNLSGQDLSNLTHAKGTPWSYARANGLQYIPDNLIQDHFVKLGQSAA